MLDKLTIDLINKKLAEGFDIEIQHRKDHIVVVTEDKKYLCKIVDK